VERREVREGGGLLHLEQRSPAPPRL
jgi:hypothetical protein